MKRLNYIELAIIFAGFLILIAAGINYAKPVNQAFVKGCDTLKNNYSCNPVDTSSIVVPNYKIEGHLRVHEKITVSHRQIYYLLKETKRNKSIGYVRRIKGKTRYERTHSMSLLHMDWKDVHTNPMLTTLDDHSRFVTASDKFSNATMENSIKQLEIVVKRFGKPNQVLCPIPVSCTLISIRKNAGLVSA